MNMAAARLCWTGITEKQLRTVRAALAERAADEVDECSNEFRAWLADEMDGQLGSRNALDLCCAAITASEYGPKCERGNIARDTIKAIAKAWRDSYVDWRTDELLADADAVLEACE